MYIKCVDQESLRGVRKPYVRYGNYIVPGNVPDQPRLWQSPSVGHLIVAGLPSSPSPFFLNPVIVSFAFNQLCSFIAAPPPRPPLSAVI